MLSATQRYAIATAMATTATSVVLAKLVDNADAIAFANRIAKHYKRKDGFIPRPVIVLCK